MLILPFFLLISLLDAILQIERSGSRKGENGSRKGENGSRKGENLSRKGENGSPNGESTYTVDFLNVERRLIEHVIYS